MKTNINKYKHLLLFVLLAILFSCEKYLDEPKPTNVVYSDAVYSSEDGILAFLNGIYRNIRLSTGVCSWYFARANKGTLCINNGNWYVLDYQHANRNPNQSSDGWEEMYYTIDKLNNFIEGVNNSKLTEDLKIKLLAEARALRAFFNFQLVLDYSPSYTANPSFSAPPLVRKPTNEHLPMSTNKEMYDFINEDLDYALANLKDTRSDKDKYRVNLTVAKGIKVRVLMSMNQDWNDIISLSQEIYGTVDKALVTYDDGFADASREDWLWAMIQTSDQTIGFNLAPASFTSSDGYNNISINDLFVQQFKNTDVRYLFTDTKANDFKRYTTTKYKFAFDTDMLIMRKAEFLLAHIEGLYHTGNETAAHNLLFELQKKRDPQAVKSTNTTGNALFEEILLERKKEHYIEFGVEYFDNRRLQRGMEREGNHQTKVTLEINDKRWFLCIPRKEIDANKKIDASINDDRL